jgi:hypothetical protein
MDEGGVASGSIKNRKGLLGSWEIPTNFHKLFSGHLHILFFATNR